MSEINVTILWSSFSGVHCPGGASPTPARLTLPIVESTCPLSNLQVHPGTAHDSLEAWGEAAEVIFLSNCSETFGGGAMWRIVPPTHCHSATSPNSSQENRRPQTEDYKSPQPRQAAGTLWFVAAGWRPEVFVFVNRNGERQEGKAWGMGTPRQNWKPPAYLPLR